MIKSISEKLTNYIIFKGVVKRKEYEIYFYGFQIALEVIFNFFVTIIIALVFGVVEEVIFFLLAFIPLRAFAGGTHLKYYCQCFIISIAIIFVSIYISFCISFLIVYLMALNTILMLLIYSLSLWNSCKADLIYFRIRLIFTFIWIWLIFFAGIILKEKNLLISCALVVEFISLIISKKYIILRSYRTKLNRFPSSRQ